MSNYLLLHFIDDKAPLVIPKSRVVSVRQAEPAKRGKKTPSVVVVVPITFPDGYEERAFKVAESVEEIFEQLK